MPWFILVSFSSPNICFWSLPILSRWPWVRLTSATRASCFSYSCNATSSSEGRNPSSCLRPRKWSNAFEPICLLAWGAVAPRTILTVHRSLVCLALFLFLAGACNRGAGKSGSRRCCHPWHFHPSWSWPRLGSWILPLLWDRCLVLGFLHTIFQCWLHCWSEVYTWHRLHFQSVEAIRSKIHTACSPIPGTSCGWCVPEFQALARLIGSRQSPLRGAPKPSKFRAQGQKARRNAQGVSVTCKAETLLWIKQKIHY